jgi:3-phenylpropionate/trans-cinnamate dioxygenase ferredoxin reductase subunit
MATATKPLGRIVAGGLAGARTCDQLRRCGHDGETTLVAAQPHLPYDRTPPSKEVLRGDGPDPARLADPSVALTDA